MSARLVCAAGLHPMSGANLSARGHCKRCEADKRRQSRAAGRQPVPVPRPPAWMDDALCAQSDPDAWFPETGQWSAVTVAKRVCEACPVRAVCLEYALERRERHGVWGGLAPEERRVLLRRRAAIGQAA